MIEEILRDVLTGMLYGSEAALIGYMKSEDLPLSWTAILHKKFWESFDPVKAVKTVVLGGVLGAFTQGMSFVPNSVFPDAIEKAVFLDVANTAIVMGVDQFVKFVVRRTPIVNVWNWIKEKLVG